MPNYPNIDKSAFLPDTYIGYSANTVWTIVPQDKGWRATPRTDPRYKPVYRATLAQISVELQRLSDEYVRARQLCECIAVRS